jgi:hypothetical protein
LCFCFVFLRLVYPVLPVYLNFPFLNASSVFSNVYHKKMGGYYITARWKIQFTLINLTWNMLLTLTR